MSRILSEFPERPSVEARFWDKVEIDDPDGCWQWTAATNGVGYGRFYVGGERGSEYAHRFAYELLCEPIPEGLTIDHLCRNRGCVNPAHLEPVPMGVNVLRGFNACADKARKTHCKRGHPLFGDNLYLEPKTGKRKCHACQREQKRRAWRDRQEQAA